jgi:hypothetical protein
MANQLSELVKQGSSNCVQLTKRPSLRRDYLVLAFATFRKLVASKSFSSLLLIKVPINANEAAAWRCFRLNNFYLSSLAMLWIEVFLVEEISQTKNPRGQQLSRISGMKQ